MANDFRSARFWAREMIEGAMYEGARAIDATMGNGHDTLWLCELAGETGRVYAFDVQPEAVERTRQRLTEAGIASRASLFCAGHERMAEFVEEAVDAVVFNLGWLPGAEHGVTTHTDTTLKAVDAALSLLKEDGLMTVCIYPGHDEGMRELNALLEWGAKLDDRRYDVLLKTYLNQPNNPPRMMAVRKKKTKQKREV
ncbi:MAG: methyltransferase domain-containing protein [Clostridia bacterium]|nr:methyltransferase domain-containing protein [Clostridia bacterium]